MKSNKNKGLSKSNFLEKPLFSNILELLTGIEPVTSTLPMLRTTDCAIAAELHLFYYKSTDMSIYKMKFLPSNKLHCENSCDKIGKDSCRNCVLYAVAGRPRENIRKERGNLKNESEGCSIGNG